MKNLLYSLALLTATCISANTEFKHTPFTSSAAPLVVKMQDEYYMIAGKLLEATITTEVKKLSPRTAQRILTGLQSDDINKRKNAARLLAENNCSLERLHFITSQVVVKKNPDDCSALSDQFAKMDTTEQETINKDFDARNIRLHQEKILNPLVCALESRINEVSTTRFETFRKVVLFSAISSTVAVVGLKYKNRALKLFQNLRSFTK